MCGPIESDIQQNRYFINVVDNFSHYYYIGLLQYKSEAVEYIISLILKLEKQLNRRVLRVRSDNSQEFVNQQLKQFLQEKGIQQELTVYYSPEQNGIVERHNRIIITKVRAMLLRSQLPNSFWGFAAKSASLIKNYSISKPLDENTPYSIVFNTTDYTIDHLHT